MKSSLSIYFMFLFLLFLCFFIHFSSCVDFITLSQPIKDPETLSSGDFKLGFFTPKSSTNRYLGIWYTSKPATIVWVANRNKPLKDFSGILKISEDGNLMVLNSQKQTLWSSNVSNIHPNSSITAQLLDTGNLVLKDNNRAINLWESFQHPSDTMLPNLKLRTNPRTGEKVKLTSWKSLSDPSTGSFSASVERLDVPELMVYNGSKPYWRTGPWNGTVFLGIYQMAPRYLTGFSVGKEEDYSSYIYYDDGGQSYLSSINLNLTGQVVLTAWSNRTKLKSWVHQDSECDVYGLCMEFGVCNRQNSTICSCLKGFEPKKPKEWNTKNWTNGCVRRTPLQCKGDGFLKLENIKVPDFAKREELNEMDCRANCLKNCSCLGYAYDSYIQCMYWSDSFIDMQKFPHGGVDLYIRLANSELVKEEVEREDKNNADDRGRNHMTLIMRIIIAISITIAGIVAACSYFLWVNATKLYKGTTIKKSLRESIIDSKPEKLEELPMFEFDKIMTATNNFHLDNKIGEGGFGSVYKGKLEETLQIIAVKRLSRVSRQGLEEFMNEVKVISKLQHRNLVKLLGCCVEQEENMLIYEYMPNKSLDAMLFDPKKKIVLDWKRRYVIIEGIARGLLYLHKDSRLKIIHRDLKAGNILLDRGLNPKISDFGLAKIFGDSEVAGNTRRIVGTYGYMSPEYALKGLFSEKLDVFSFGVLLLEIISGTRSIDFYREDMSLSLQGYAWKLWNENNSSSFIDQKMDHPTFHKDIIRCIHIGLLCVQELAKDRPNMALVTSMICGEIIDLPFPKKPAFTLGELCQLNGRDCSINMVSLTDIQVR